MVKAELIQKLSAIFDDARLAELLATDKLCSAYEAGDLAELPAIQWVGWTYMLQKQQSYYTYIIKGDSFVAVKYRPENPEDKVIRNSWSITLRGFLKELERATKHHDLSMLMLLRAGVGAGDAITLTDLQRYKPKPIKQQIAPEEWDAPILPVVIDSQKTAPAMAAHTAKTTKAKHGPRAPKSQDIVSNQLTLLEV